jgi:hypothetical protein
MAITNLLKINNVDVPKLRKYVVGIEPLVDNAGRNLQGTLKASFVGNFLKIECEIGYTTSTEMTTLRGLLDPFSVTVKWYNEATGALVTTSMYTSPYKYGIFRKDVELYEPFSFSLISFAKL